MVINKIPGVYYTESLEYDVVGEGAKIPVFIGKTGNTGTTSYKVDGSVVLSFNSYEEACRATTAGGIGTDPETNPLLAVLKDFFEENIRKTAGDIQVPKVYVIDCGSATTIAVWTTAIATSKAMRDANVEVYVGAESITDEDKSINDVIEIASTSLAEHATNLMLRNGFFTDATADTDAELISLAQANQLPRIGLIEPLLFGKTIARICCTPFYIEPGYTAYRSVEKDTFIKRTPTAELALQNAGVIFNRDEMTTQQVFPKINLAVGTEFGKSPRPADSLFHARFNADELLKQIFDVCYPQIKANETATNISYLQSQVDRIIDDAVQAGYMRAYDGLNGTRIRVTESDADPFDLELTGQIQPVNATIAINVTSKIIGAI